MKCSIQGCLGEYEDREVIHTVKQRGKIFVIDHVPAEVCSFCGDVLLTPATVRHIENLVQAEARPNRMVPLYEFAA